jgi:hypothetical protein
MNSGSPLFLSRTVEIGVKKKKKKGKGKKSDWRWL